MLHAHRSVPEKGQRRYMQIHICFFISWFKTGVSFLHTSSIQQQIISRPWWKMVFGVSLFSFPRYCMILWLLLGFFDSVNDMYKNALSVDIRDQSTQNKMERWCSMFGNSRSNDVQQLAFLNWSIWGIDQFQLQDWSKIGYLDKMNCSLAY